MKISLYTFVRNGIQNDFHVEAMLRHHAPFVDEIIINEGYSTDGTYERISDIAPNIRIFRSHWGDAKDISWYVAFKEAARRQCSGDWCILLDCDEFIPEGEFDELRKRLLRTSDVMLFAKFLNFYGNYRVFHDAPQLVNWPQRKMIIHRNDPNIEIWGDGSNVRLKGEKLAWGDSGPAMTVHHFGMVRDPGILRYKWWIQGRAYRSRFIRVPRFIFNVFPHDWMDKQFFDNLAIYDGPIVDAVRRDPGEFIRDRMRLAHKLGWKGEIQ